MIQPVEIRPTFNTCNSSLAHITCTTKLINIAAHLARAHLAFCTSWGQTDNYLNIDLHLYLLFFIHMYAKISQVSATSHNVPGQSISTFNFFLLT